MKVRGVILKTELSGLLPELRERRALVRQGVIRPVGQWYVTAEAPADLVAVLGQGLRPTCLDAAALHGLWVPPSQGVHVYRPRATGDTVTGLALTPIRRRREARSGQLVPREDAATGRLCAPEPAVLHGSGLRSWPDSEPVPGIIMTLQHAARCQSLVYAAILIESALEQGALRRAELHQVLEPLPGRLRESLSRVRSDAQSGTETAVRWWLEQRGVPVRSQVQILRGVRVDLLVGNTWVIECDSRQFHDDPLQYQRDRERDLALAARGYRVTRLTWEQVFITWENTTQMLQEILRRREHRRALPAA